MYRIVYDREIIKFLRKVPVKSVERLKLKIEEVATDPFKINQNLQPLRGMENGYRLRVGNLRVIFELEIKDKLMTIWKIDFRGAVYKRTA